ncbi:MAG: flagellin, partial [Thermoguttaceae bacterium]
TESITDFNSLHKKINESLNSVLLSLSENIQPYEATKSVEQAGAAKTTEAAKSAVTAMPADAVNSPETVECVKSPEPLESEKSAQINVSAEELAALITKKEQEAEQKRIEEEKKAAEIAEQERKAAAAEAKEIKRKEFEEKLKREKENADKMYFARSKAMLNVKNIELPQERQEEKSFREKKMESIFSEFANGYASSGTSAGKNLATNYTKAEAEKMLLMPTIGAPVPVILPPRESEDIKNQILLGQQSFLAVPAVAEKENDSPLTDDIAKFALTSEVDKIGTDKEDKTENETNKTKEDSDKDSDETAKEPDESETEPLPPKSWARYLEDLKSGGKADLRTDAEAADKYLEEMIRSVSLSRAGVGAEMIENAAMIELYTTQIFYDQKTEAEISDADIAEEMSNLARYQILIQTGMKALKIAQDLPKMFFDMLS